MMIKRIVGWFERHYIISYLIAILIALLIFYLSSRPSSFYPTGLGIATKVYHFLIFSLLSLFIGVAIIRGRIKYKYFILIAILISTLYATTDEIHQFFVPGRTAALGDVLIDSLGILTSGIFYSARSNKN
jgi:VanZ family protein